MKDIDVLSNDAYQGNEDVSVSYCEDYIVIDLYSYSESEAREHKELLIYDIMASILWKTECTLEFFIP